MPALGREQRQNWRSSWSAAQNAEGSEPLETGQPCKKSRAMVLGIEREVRHVVGSEGSALCDRHATELGERVGPMKRNVKPASAVLSLALCICAEAALGLEPCGAPVDEVFSNGFGIGPTISAGSETIYAPPATVEILPDEHSSFLPPATDGGPYIFFEAARVGRTGAVVLQTTRFKKFSLAAG